jgi:eukaryotic-like serine/threonine-protein kinase
LHHRADAGKPNGASYEVCAKEGGRSMIFGCPNCGQSLEFSGQAPKFCAFCGKVLGDSVLASTAPDLHEAPTVAHTPYDAENSAAVANSAAVPDRIAGYKLIRSLGQGGMGAVFEAEESDSGRKVAIKLVSPEFTASPDSLQRFRQEGRLASAIAHSRCVFVLAADEEEGRPYIVMELMPGSNLHDLVKDQGPLSVQDAVVKILDVIEGLGEAHRLGVIHRDVKPSNCFLEADGRIKVGDFGLSKSLVNDSNLTRTGAFLGTPLYASPEQIKGDAVDPRTDVYSVAATLYFVLTGRAPFQGNDAAATLARIVSDPAPSMRSIRPEIPVELDRIVLRGLDRNRDRRYRTMEDFAAALQPFAPGRLAIAGLGLRAAAYAIDVWITKFAIITAVNVGRGILSKGSPWRGFGPDMKLSAMLDMLVYVFSFFIVEAFFRASPGKWMLRLRVRGDGASGKDLPRFWLRALIFYVCSGLGWEILVFLDLFPGSMAGYALGFSVRLAGLAVLCSTMRRSNGFRGLHEIGSGTRVVVLPRLPRRKIAESRRALGKDRGVAARPIGVMQNVGPFRVRGAIRWEDGRKVLSAEDSSLGREAWVVLRPKSSPPPEMPRRSLNRPTRPRWLSGGEQHEGRWDAFVAPSGSPLADVAGSDGLPWRDARPLIEDLADELSAACEDGTLPPGLTVDQVWVQPDGRALLVDQLGKTGETLVGNDQARALALLRRSAALALEGGRRRLDDVASAIRCPIPLHASGILSKLDTTKPGSYQDVRSLRADLAATRDLPTEVDRASRAIQLGVMAAILSFSLALFFGAPCLLMIDRFQRPNPDPVTIEAEAVAPEVALRRDTGAAASSERPFDAERARRLEDAKWAISVIVIGIALGWTILSAATLGGLSYLLMGLGLVRLDGVRAGRLRIAWRAFLVWLVPTALVVGALMLQDAPTAGWKSWVPFLTALGLVVAYLPIALINPSRAPHDRLAGTVVVPK